MIKYLIQKEFLQIRRNAFLPRLIIIFPIMIMCVMPWVMNQEVRNIRVSVVDHDHSSLSARLVHSIEQSNYFRFRGMQPSYELARKEIEKSRTDIILVISKGYGKVAEMKAKGNAIPSEEDRGKILIAANAVNGVKGGIGASYLSQIVMASANPDAAALQSAVSTFYLYNKHLNYKLFMIPALLAIVMMLMCSFLPALNIVSEKETGTIEQINVTPVSKWSFILAKLI
ncbi:MAG: ABC transporter permease, partial [Bacteroidaceae bacterium]|nr:ABC transporter permease [Bacteroidaceae bacterium]